MGGIPKIAGGAYNEHNLLKWAESPKHTVAPEMGRILDGVRLLTKMVLAAPDFKIH